MPTTRLHNNNQQLATLALEIPQASRSGCSQIQRTINIPLRLSPANRHAGRQRGWCKPLQLSLECLCHLTREPHGWNCMLLSIPHPTPTPRVLMSETAPPAIRACSNTDQFQQLLIKILRFVLIHNVNWSWWLASLIRWFMTGKQISHSSWDCLRQLVSAHLDECKRPLSLSPGFFFFFGALLAPMCYVLPPDSISLLAHCFYSPVPLTPPTSTSSEGPCSCQG